MVWVDVLLFGVPFSYNMEFWSAIALCYGKKFHLPSEDHGLMATASILGHHPSNPMRLVCSSFLLSINMFTITHCVCSSTQIFIMTNYIWLGVFQVLSSLAYNIREQMGWFRHKQHGTVLWYIAQLYCQWHNRTSSYQSRTKAQLSHLFLLCGLWQQLRGQWWWLCRHHVPKVWLHASAAITSQNGSCII